MLKIRKYGKPLAYKKTGKPYSGRGSSHWKSVMTEDLVREMRHLHATTKHSARSLAEMYGLGERAVSRMLSRATWQHVE